MQNTQLLIYGIFAAAVASAITITSGTNHKILGFLLTFWILGASVIREPVFDLPVMVLGGKMQMAQLLFYLLTAHLFFLSLLRFRLDEPLFSLPFEKYLYIFLGWLACVLIYHYSRGELGGRELRAVGEGNLAFLVIYLNLKRFGDSEMLCALGKAVIAVAALSSSMALLQFIGGSGFLLVGEARPIFAGHIRGFGVFSSEYLHSYTTVTALLLTLLFVNSWKLRAALIPLLVTGIVASFHRMSWIVAGIIILLYLVYEKEIRVARIAFILVTCFVVVYLLAIQFATVFQDMQSSALVQSRLGSDTMTGRFRQYSMVLDLFNRNPIWGVGTTQSTLYFYGMLSVREGLRWARGEAGGIHNIYLYLLFLYGVPLLVLFCLFVGSMLLTWRSLVRNGSRFYLVPFSFTLAYCVLNLTDCDPLSSHLGMLFALIAGAGAFVAGRSLSGSTDDFSLPWLKI
jgi:hypothetical protein